MPSAAALPEDLVALRVFDLQHDRLVAGRLAGRTVERERPQVHGLPGLVDRLVGCKEDALAALEPDRLIGGDSPKMRYGCHA